MKPRRVRSLHPRRNDFISDLNTTFLGQPEKIYPAGKEFDVGEIERRDGGYSASLKDGGLTHHVRYDSEDEFMKDFEMLESKPYTSIFKEYYGPGAVTDLATAIEQDKGQFAVNYFGDYYCAIGVVSGFEYACAGSEKVARLKTLKKLRGLSMTH